MGKDEFVVITFQGEKSGDGKPLVELVRTGGLKITSTKLRCAFPNPSYKNVNELVKAKLYPDPDWSDYPVKVLGYAGTGPKRKQYDDELNEVSSGESGLGDSVAHNGSRKNRRMKRQQQRNSNWSAKGQLTSLRDSSDSSDSSFVNKGFTYKLTPVKCSTESMQTPGRETPPRKTQITPRSILSSARQTLTVVNEGRTDKFITPTKRCTESMQTPRSDTPPRQSPRRSPRRTQTPRSVASDRQKSTKKTDYRPRELDDFDYEDPILKRIRQLEEHLTDTVVRVKRSLNHDLKKLRNAVEEFRGTVQLCLKSSGQEGVTLDLDQFKIGEENMPFDKIDTFEEFNKDLDNKETYSALVTTLTGIYIPISKNMTITRSLSDLISTFMSKDVAQLYCGQGKSHLKKLNFSKTKFYSALEKAVLDADAKTSSKGVIHAVSTVLAKSGDVDGGRTARINNDEVQDC